MGRPSQDSHTLSNELLLKQKLLDWTAVKPLFCHRKCISRPLLPESQNRLKLCTNNISLICLSHISIFLIIYLNLFPQK